MTIKKNEIKRFNWRGINMQGLRVQGTRYATNHAELHEKLCKENIYPIKVKQDKYSLYKKKITSSEITDFSRQIATLVAANIPLAAALAIIEKSTNKAILAFLISSIKDHVENGYLFSDALKRYPCYFDELFCNLIYVGEQSGSLEAMLNEVASYREKLNSLKQKIKKALYYPLTILTVAMIVCAIMLTMVIPKFAQLFQSFGSQLPLLTRLVIKLADTVKQYGWIFILALLGAAFFYQKKIKHSSRFLYKRDQLFLVLPIAGGVIRKIILARCFCTLKSTFAAGMPLTDAFTAAAKIAGNQLFANEFLTVSQKLHAGSSVQDALKTGSLFPSWVTALLAIGEESGRLQQMFGHLAHDFSEQADLAAQTISQLFEPVIMIILCVFVGILIVSMYLPVFRLGTVI